MLNLLRMDLHRMGRSASTWVILACTVLVALFCVAMTDGDIQDMADDPQYLAQVQGEGAGTQNRSVGIYVEADANWVDGPIEAGDIVSAEFHSGMLALLCVIFTAMFGYAEQKNGYVKNLAGQFPHRGLLVLSKLLAVALQVLVMAAVLAAGISANLSCGGVYFGAPGDFSPAACPDCDHQRQLTEEFHGAGNGQILVDASIHGEYTSNVPLWQWMANYAQRKGLGMHVHVSETQSEHEGSLTRWGLTPFRILDRYGVWDTRAIAAHCVWTTEDDWAGMAEKGVACVHNPVSNLKLGSGVAWIPAMKAAGVPIALGTDGVSSNNNQDMFEEMKFAAVLHNGVTRNPLALLPQDVLAMATREGAKALGRKTGRIAPGYVADLILVDFTRPHLTPCHSVMDNLVYAAHGSDVVMNMARGKIIYKDGTFLTLDLEKIQAEVKSYALPRLFGDGKTW